MLAYRRTEYSVDSVKVVFVENQPGRGGIEAHVFGGDGLGDGDDTGLPQNPRQGNLGRCDLMSTGDLLEGGAGQQFPTLGDWAVSHQRQVMLLPPGQQVEFNAALFDVVEHLIGGAGG